MTPHLWTSIHSHSGGSKKAADKEETKRAEHSIRHSIEVVEQKIHNAVQDEVDTLFHKSPEKKEQVSTQAKKAVEQGTAKIKEQVKERSEIHHYPYEWPAKTEAHAPKHRDYKILHAVENAEKAVLHAVEEEVNNLFHGMDHPHEDEKEHAKTVVKKGVKKASEKVDEGNEKRRKFLMMDDTTSIEDYIKTIPAME